ncbi:MAG: acyl-CoA dehydrogenase [Chloroflexi bacterium]|nr:acyl-CoA dehydrogenase [Chloroflexota bacterium]MBM4451444.1 acyl-CoA dehydrogenase [Chloroflexota bacterium]MBM4454168.1 acyl-CoA dehydrogenase [Chloroflexota bacterium]
MDYSLSEQQEMLKKSARDFLSSESPKSLVRQMATDEKGFPPQLYNKMADLGWLGLNFPEKHGGTDASFLDLAVLLEEMGRACLPGPFFASSVISGMTIMELGSESQKQELLPKIASGQTIVTLAITEPESGYNPDKLKTNAVADKTEYLITGTKILVPYAHIANYCICTAKTSAGIALFLIDGSSSGIKLTPLKTIISDKQFEAVFNKVKVPKKSLLGKEGKVQAQLQQIMLKAAVAKCAEMVGGAQQVLEMTVDYVKERKQFGVPVGSFQAIQHHCANMLIDIDTSRFLTYQAAWKISEGLPFAKDASIAKAWVSDAYKRVTKLGHQCIGGVSLIEDHDMPLFSKGAKAAELTFGDADYHRELVAQELGL